MKILITFTVLFACFLGFVSSAYAATKLDNTVWKIVSKTCNSKPLNVSENERLQFANGIFTHIYLFSETEMHKCNRAQVFNSAIESRTDNSGVYFETAKIFAGSERTVCKDKANGMKLSDVTTPLVAPIQSLSLLMNENSGKVELKGSPFCADGVLQLELLQN